MSCYYTATTAAGDKLALDDPDCPVYARVGPVSVHVTDAQQLRGIEEEFGRVLLEQRAGGPRGAVLGTSLSAQSTNARSAGDTDLERRLGTPIASALGTFTRAGAGPGAVEDLGATMARSRHVRESLRAVQAAGPMATGGANRWTRQLRRHLGGGGDARQLVEDLRLLWVDAHGRDGLRVGGGLAVRDLDSALFTAGVIKSFAAGAQRRGAGAVAGPVDDEAAAVVNEVLERARTNNSWATSSRHTPRATTMSGFKAHVYCDSFEDVEAAVTRLGPVLVARGLDFKVAPQGWVEAIGDDDHQVRKGVTVYFPSRADLADDAAAVGEAMAGWHRFRAPGDDVQVMPGVGLRYELVADLGTDVELDDYFGLYTPTARIVSHPEAFTETVAAVQRVCHDRTVEPAALADWMGAVAGSSNSWHADHRCWPLLPVAAEFAAAGVEPDAGGWAEFVRVRDVIRGRGPGPERDAATASALAGALGRLGNRTARAR